MEEEKHGLADRLFRAEHQMDFSSWPFVRKWQANHPVLLQCVCCQQWEAFARHRDVKKSAWARYQSWGAWIHTDCIAEWEEHGAEMTEKRVEEARRRESTEFLFGQPDLLSSYDGVLVRSAPYYEHTFYGILDDMEASISADFGLQRLYKVIDEMSDEGRGRLVGAGFLGFYHRYRLIFGWAGSIPAEYDGTEFDDVACESFLVGDLPRLVRDELPETLRSLV